MNPNDVATTAVMRYSTSQAVVEGGGGQTASVSPGSWPDGTATTRSVTSTITGLSANTTYYYQLQATNTSGVGNGGVKSVTTKIGGEHSPDDAEQSSWESQQHLPGQRGNVRRRTAHGPSDTDRHESAESGVGPVCRCGHQWIGQLLGCAHGRNESDKCEVQQRRLHWRFRGYGLKVLGVSTNVTKVKGSGSKRKVDLSGKTYKGKQTVTVYKRKNGKDNEDRNHHEQQAWELVAQGPEGRRRNRLRIQQGEEARVEQGEGLGILATAPRHPKRRQPLRLA